MEAHSTDAPAPREWLELQESLRRRVVTADQVSWQLPSGALTGKSREYAKDAPGDASELPLRPLRRLGGVDISFMKDTDLAVASLVVLDLASKTVVYEAFQRVTLDLQYIPGFLAFREVPHLRRLIQELRERSPELMPDIIMVDGNGVLHPRGCGLASHLGVCEGVQTIGVGKTFMHVDGITKKKLQEALGTKGASDDCVMLHGASGNVHAAAFYANNTIKNPVYISVGHGLSLTTAVEKSELGSRSIHPSMDIAPAKMRDRTDSIVPCDARHSLVVTNSGSVRMCPKPSSGKSKEGKELAKSSVVSQQ